MSKRIRDFLQSKLRRSELTGLTLELEGQDDPELGPLEGTLTGPGGSAWFHERGLILEGGLRVVYGDLQQVEQTADGPLELLLRSGTRIRLRVSPAGGEVVYATLRWIGNALLHRRLAR